MLGSVNRFPQGHHRAPRVAVVGLAGLVAGLMAGGGCYDGFDPLDPEVLEEVVRTRGDALGVGHSGIYTGTFETLECGCPPIDPQLDVPYGATLCGLIEWTNTAGVDDLLRVEIVQADGSVRVRAQDLTASPEDQPLLLPVLYGPLGSDGQISAGGMLQANALIVQGEARARIDGTLDGEPGAGTLEVEYQQHNSVELIGSDFGVVLDGFDRNDEVLQTLDCRERVALSLQWYGPVGGGLPPGSTLPPG